MVGRPLVLGHRGAAAAAFENTIEAFARARVMGADGVELDVRRTVDGVLIVHHDPEIAGVGVLGAMTFTAARAAHPALATFAEALQEVNGLLVNVEVKCLPWEPDADTDGSVMRGALDAIDAHTTAPATSDATGNTTFVVSSFSLPAVDLAREYAPNIATGWLTHGQAVAAAAATAAEHGHAWLNPDVASALAAGPDGIAAVHAAGLKVSVWTVDEPDDARALAAAGVDIIITNVPDVILAALAN